MLFATSFEAAFLYMPAGVEPLQAVPKPCTCLHSPTRGSRLTVAAHKWGCPAHRPARWCASLEMCFILQLLSARLARSGGAEGEGRARR